MSDLIIYKWSLWCIAEQAVKYVWSDTKPQVCPTDHAHEIDPETPSIMDQMSQNIVKIKEESIVTGGNFKCETRKINVPANTSNFMDISFKYPISVYNFGFNIKDINEGDMIEVHIAPNTLIGIFITDSLVGSDKVNVSSTVMAHIMLGYHINTMMDDKIIDLGFVIAIDKDKSELTLSQTLSENIFTKMPVFMTIKVIENYEIGPAGSYIIGEGKIGGFSIPANTVIRVIYNNLSDVDKKAVAKFEYSY